MLSADFRLIWPIGRPHTIDAAMSVNTRLKTLSFGIRYCSITDKRNMLGIRSLLENFTLRQSASLKIVEFEIPKSYISAAVTCANNHDVPWGQLRDFITRIIHHNPVEYRVPVQYLIPLGSEIELNPLILDGYPDLPQPVQDLRAIYKGPSSKLFPDIDGYCEIRHSVKHPNLGYDICVKIGDITRIL